jgi:hypothetical protein
VHEAVLVLARAVDEVEHERRAAVADAQRRERATPALERLGEREVRVDLARHVAERQVVEVPGLERGGALARGELLDRAPRRVARALLELVEQREDLGLGSCARRAARSPVVEVLAAEQRAEPVALARELEETVSSTCVSIERSPSHAARRRPSSARCAASPRA